MKKPKIILDSDDTDLLNPNFGKEAYAELKQIKASREIEEYGLDFQLPSGYKHLKAGDIILLIYPEVDVYCEVEFSMLFASGIQRFRLKYKDFKFKE
jgi:hypothetical protein